MASGVIVTEVEDIVTVTGKLPISSIKVTELASELSSTHLKTPHEPHSKQSLLLNPSSITTDFDDLRFEAAAFGQLRLTNTTSPDLSHNQTHNDETSDQLISSPYNNPNHYLNLSDPHLSTQSRLFAMSLTCVKPTTPAYATAPYTEALNFDAVLGVLRDLIKIEGTGTKAAAGGEKYEWKETSFYVVVFRSQLKPAIDNDYLYLLDAESHREACESGGLLKYWFGRADGERRNLATCKFPTTSFSCFRNTIVTLPLPYPEKTVCGLTRQQASGTVATTHTLAVADPGTRKPELLGGRCMSLSSLLRTGSPFWMVRVGTCLRTGWRRSEVEEKECMSQGEVVQHGMGNGGVVL
jgi:hypothetical protein